MSTQPAIEIDGVGRDFAVSKGGAARALDDMSFSVEAGEVVALLGANGAGKTALTKILATLLLPTRGSADIRLPEWSGGTSVPVAGRCAGASSPPR